MFMAENNQNFDILSGLKKFFGFIDRVFTIVDRQYSNDGSSKFKITLDGSTIMEITCIPNSGKLDMKFSTTSEVAEGAENPYICEGVELKKVNEKIDEVKHLWFGNKFDEQTSDQPTPQNQGNQNSNEMSEEEIQEQLVNSNRILRFGLSRISGSKELMLTKVYANYDSESAMNDLSDFINDSGSNDIEDGCYELSYEDECDECFDVCPIDDFEPDYEDLMDQILCSLYEVKLCGHAYQKMFTDSDVQVFYSIHSMIEFLEDTNFKLTGGVTWPTDYEYNHCGDCCYNTAYELLYDKYVPNLSNVLDCIRLYICNFDDESRNSLIQYQTALSEFLCKLEPVHTELVEVEEPSITWEECFGGL